MKKLYIVSRHPPIEENQKILNRVMSMYKNKRALCFDLKVNRDNVSSLTLKYKKILEDLCHDKVDICMFDRHEIKEFIKNKHDANIFYFKTKGLLDYFRKFLRINQIPEDDYQLVGEGKYPPTSFVVKTNDHYAKLFTTSRGDDESFYVNFIGNWHVDSLERASTISNKTITLKKIKTNINNPYISYHSKSGIIHSKDYYGEYFIPNLKTTSLEEVKRDNGMFPFCAIVISRNSNLLPNIGEPPVETKKFNYVEINDKIPTIINTGLKAESFITINSSLLKENQSFTIELWLHKKIEDADIFQGLTENQKKNVLSYITINNDMSDLSWSVFVRYAEMSDYDNTFRLLVQIFNNEEYTICRINRQL